MVPDAPAPAGPDAEARVLIAEDNIEMSAYLRRLLGGFCRVETLSDGAQALESIRASPPDLLIADIMMPGKDGLSLCRDIKTDPAASSTLVVLLTALSDREALRRGWRAGADEYLFKPFHPDEVVTRVRTLLSSARARKRAEEALLLKTRELERSNAELRLFASFVSHELQEPLRKIATFASLLDPLSSRPDPEELRPVARIQDSARRMQLLVSDILTLCRADLERRPLEQVDLGELLREVAAEFRPALEEAGGSIHLEPLPTLAADPVQMRQLFRNLVSNACKFRKETEPPRIVVSFREPRPGLAEISVADNGIGFEDQYRERIFEPFERLNRKTAYPGSGLGLAICERILLRHGGRISARSEPGKGSTFFVALASAGKVMPDDKRRIAA